MDHLSQLNPPQREAATYTDGPLLIIAGAGAGKTKTVTHRILHLINQGIQPERILAITFTNKAAKEMRDRVGSMLGQDSNQFPGAKSIPFLSTFHSLGVYILRAHGGALGLDRFFSIYDKDESLSKVKQAIRELGIDEKRFEPRKVMHAISKLKGDSVDITSYGKNTHTDFSQSVIARVWVKYEEILKQEKALDFDDLLLKTAELFDKHPDILAHYQNRWQYIHIDEYQDTNTIQYDLTTLLAQKHKNLCVVGDIDQSIYSWRGADYKNILNFEKKYPEAKVVLLEQNYRSTQNILTAANDVIKKNKKRREKKLFTENATGEKITLYSGFSEQDEGRYIAETCFDLIRQGISPEDIAVLYRANFQSRVLEECFLRSGVPYQVLGTRFFDRKEIKDILSFIKAALNPQDRESIKRIINIPPRGIGQVTLEKIFAGQEESLPPKMQDKLMSFRNLLGRIKFKVQSSKPSELVRYIIEETGNAGEMEKGNEEDQERLENLKEFASLAVRYDDLPDTPEGMSGTEEGLMQLVTEASLVSDQDSLMQKPSGVRLMTVHASKGLEFKYVFITGLEQNLFPHSAMGHDEKRDDEEERRLFYVAVTRAKEKLFLTYAQMRTIFGSRQMTMPSEFIFDIGESLLTPAEGESVTPQTTSYIDF
jgi:DNA helicase-2/ATP-dependent DNA helicase PcrA